MEWDCCDRDRVAHKAKNIYYLALYRQSLRMPALSNKREDFGPVGRDDVAINGSKPPLRVFLPLSSPPGPCAQRQRQVLKHGDRFRVRGGHFQTPALLGLSVPSGMVGVSCVRLPST